MAELYIDYKNGNDAWTGGTLDPLKTLAHALTHAGNGDTIYVRGGDMVDEWYRTCNLTASQAGLTIQADTGHAPVFVGSIEYTTWALTGGATNVYQTAFVAPVASGVWNGATRLTSTAGIAACDALPNSFYFDNAGDLLHVNIGGAAPTSIEVYDHSTYYAIILTGTGITLSGLAYKYQMQPVDIRAGGAALVDCTFSLWVGYNNTAIFGMVRITGATHTLTGCSFDDAVAQQVVCVGAIAGASAIVATGCTVTGGYRGFWLADGVDHAITGCTISACKMQGIYLEGTAAAAVDDLTIHDCLDQQFESQSTGAVILTNSLFYHTDRTGKRSHVAIDNSSAVLIDGCTAYESLVSAFRINNSSGTVRNCLAYDCAHSGFWVGGTGTVTFHHCLFYLTQDTAGSGLDQYGYVVDPTNTTVFFYHCVAANLLLNSSSNKRFGFVIQNNDTITYRNCVAYSCNVGYKVGLTAGGGGWTPTIDNDYNGAFANNLDYQDFPAGVHDVTIDPLFVDPAATFDFHLLIGSPYIDTGAIVVGINDGTGGSTKYNGAAPDIGRYEKQPTVQLALTGVG